MLFVGIEEENALHKMLIKHPRMPDKKQMLQAELSKVVQLRVHKSTDKVEKQRAPPLDVVLLQEASEQGQGLLADQVAGVFEAGGDGTDVGVHLSGVADSKVTEYNHNVVAYGGVAGG